MVCNQTVSACTTKLGGVFMSIFNFNKNSVSFSRDWELFQKFMGNIGAFTYIANEKTAYMDPVTCRLLNCSHEKINEYEFFNLLDKISKNPVEGQKHIYMYTTENQTYYIKMNIFESSDVWLGFVQDYTRQIKDNQSNKNIIDYNPITRLPTYSFFTRNMKEILPSIKKCCLATIRINGIDKLSTFLTVENTNHCITSITEVLKSFESDKITLGTKSDYEICVLFMNYDRMTVNNILNSMDEAVQKCIPTDDFGEVIDISDKTTLNLSIGCCSYPEQAIEFNTLVNYSEFALYEATANRRSVINWFNESNYLREKDSYKNAQILNRLISDNLFTYHLQPIVDAKTGDIFGYEALMRINADDIDMSPLQILRIADEQNNLYSIEKSTFFNTIKLLSENQHFFSNRKLFINCLADNLLTDEEFNELYLTYGELFEKIVVEINERSQLNDESIEIIKKRCKFSGARLAIDDYGAGYSNSANLLHYAPEYIKIDRSLICDIQNDLKKQQLFASIVDFCHANHLMSLAEGVETLAEMKTVIRMGVDLIQGYYTSKPKPLFLDKISSDVVDEIISTNLENRSEGTKKIYNARNETELDLLKLALEKYTDITVHQSKLTLVSDASKQVKMNILIPDNSSCELTIKNINILSGNNRPSIILGEYSRLELNVLKKNKLSYSGIYVPQGSQIEIKGSGDLLIDSFATVGIGIGNDFEHSYGDIFINMTGSLEIMSNNEDTVCIGGGYNTDDSEIKLISGYIKVDMHSKNGLAVGSFNGNSIIKMIDPCRLDIFMSGIKAVGVGSFFNSADISLESNIDISCSGAHAVGIGVLEKGTGDIAVSDSKINIKMRSARHSCIGTYDGDMNVKLSDSDIKIDSEGDEAVGIGDYTGSGNTILTDTTLSSQIYAAFPLDIGSKNGDVSLHDCNIESIVNGKHINHS